MIRGNAERLPMADASFDFVTVGYALRHVTDLASAFQEFRRVLRPGGTLLLLEIARPQGLIRRRLVKWYLGRMVPLLCRWLMPQTKSATLMGYFWDTIENCVGAGRHPRPAGGKRLRPGGLRDRSGPVLRILCEKT